MDVIIVCYSLYFILCQVQHHLSVQGLAARSTFLPQKVSFSEIHIHDNNVVDGSSNNTVEGKTIGERIKFGESIVEINNIVTREECTWLVDACLQAAKDDATNSASSSSSSRQNTKPGLVRIPTIAAAKRAAATQTPCGNPLPLEVDLVLQNILQRTAEYIDKELPSIPSRLLFGTITSDSFSLANSFTKNQLKYSSREPAINVYTKGGKFLAHTDAQALTVLIPLSCPDHGDFSGGGTAFWSQDSRGHRVEDPSLIRKPKGGTAILFGGCVTHSGVPVDGGDRVVFVTSFSQSL